HLNEIKNTYTGAGPKRPSTPPRVIKWLISKAGFATPVSGTLGASAWSSTYSQLEALGHWLSGKAEKRPEPEHGQAIEFELVIPMEQDSELIAARTAEQIAMSAGFDQPAINQIKTAMIEACINAAEHGESTDRKIYQTFRVTSDKFIITVSNKG